jgi:hypothetical protein
MTPNETPTPSAAHLVADAINASDLDFDLLLLCTDPQRSDAPQSLADAVSDLDYLNRFELLELFEFCPIHACDAQICLDDDNRSELDFCAPFIS